MVVEDSNEEDTIDPMVSAPIRPFVIQITLQNPHTTIGVRQGALIDSGCTRCLMCKSVAVELGLRVLTVKIPIKFEQMDGSTLGETPATQVLELVRLEIGEHWEHI